jgi:hypothetical protein
MSAFVLQLIPWFGLMILLVVIAIFALLGSLKRNRDKSD